MLNEINNFKVQEKKISNNKNLIFESYNKKSYKENNYTQKSKRKSNYELFLENNYYYPNIFEDYEELNNNCIYCISGKAFNYLYKNKKRNKKLLEKIHQNCKIYYNMSSENKSYVTRFYQQYENSCICYIGSSTSDSNSIITSNIGICLEIPKNQNTILCHFYTDILNFSNLKNIIFEGKAIHENIIFLKIASIFCTMIINSYILCCFICNIDVLIGQLNILETSLIIFSISAFTGKTNNEIIINPLKSNNKLYKYFCITQIIGLLVIKIVNIYLLCSNHINGPNEDSIENAKIFCTFYFILCMELLFSSVFVFNYNSFYRKNIFENKFFIIFVLFFFLYLHILLTLNSSNYRFDIFNITYFEFLNELIDSYSDRNKILTVIVFIIDFGCSFIYSIIVYYIYDKLAKNK